MDGCPRRATAANAAAAAVVRAAAAAADGRVAPTNPPPPASVAVEAPLSVPRRCRCRRRVVRAVVDGAVGPAVSG